MNTTSVLLTVYSLLLILSLTHGKKKKPECSVCKDIVENFKKGLDATKKSNYGGGNTDWEESRLGQYSNSEVRLEEIMEALCAGSGKDSLCPQMREEHEAAIEEFWSKYKSDEERKQNFYQEICIEKVEACCPENTYGPSCKECAGGKERPCKGNGKCQGAGTRAGSGKCRCQLGYEGPLCDNCKTGYYEALKNDTDTVCKVCHISCKTSCTGDGPTKCDECKAGWTQDAEKGCQDINECNDNPCSSKEYCINTQGSHTCLSCNVACDGCTGSGNDKCVQCHAGYQQTDGKCLDIDECAAEGGDKLCSLEGQQCENTVGSYKCSCLPGYIKDGDACKLKPPDKPKTEEKKSQNRRHSNNHRGRDQREESLITLFIAFTALSIIFFVIAKLCYLINPYLLSVPVAVFAIIIYYMIKKPSPETDDEESGGAGDTDNTPKPDQGNTTEQQNLDKNTGDKPKEEL